MAVKWRRRRGERQAAQVDMVDLCITRLQVSRARSVVVSRDNSAHTDNQTLLFVNLFIKTAKRTMNKIITNNKKKQSYKM